jgi:hypothetical protein
MRSSVCCCIEACSWRWLRAAGKVRLHFAHCQPWAEWHWPARSRRMRTFWSTWPVRRRGVRFKALTVFAVKRKSWAHALNSIRHAGRACCLSRRCSFDVRCASLDCRRAHAAVWSARVDDIPRRNRLRSCWLLRGASPEVAGAPGDAPAD